MQTYPPGTRIGQYEIASLPMMGGMGVVYFAIDHGNDGRPVALKTFRPELLPDRAARDRFLREGTAWVKLGKHENIVRCYEVEYHDPTAFLVLELITKEQGMPDASLRSRLVPGRPLPIEQALLFALQIARGMQHATEKIPGFVHRDLKPENILVGADRLLNTNVNRLRVTDFGLATMLKDEIGKIKDEDIRHTQLTHGTVGTPLYMAPEQWMGKAVGAYTDVYAFGCILYEMISGQCAVKGETISQLQDSHCGGKLHLSSQSLPNDVDALLTKCLMTNPSLRYGGWGELIKAIDRTYTRQFGYPVPRLAISAELSREERVQVSWSYNAIGVSYMDLGKLESSLQYFELVLVSGETEGNSELKGANLVNTGNVYTRLGNAQRAIEYYEQAIVIYREIKNRLNEGVCLGDLGLAYANLGDSPRAIGCYEQALQIANDFGDRRSEANTLGNLGSVYDRLGDSKRAILCYEKSLEIFREISDRRGEENILMGLGILYTNLGNTQQAIGYHELALQIARTIGDRWGEGEELGNLGNIYTQLGDIPRAITHHQQYLKIVREIGDQRGEGSALNDLGDDYRKLNNIQQALEYYNMSLIIFRLIGDRRGEGVVMGNMGSAYRNLGDVPRAIEYYRQQLVIVREIRDRSGEGIALMGLGNVLGDTQQAIECYKQSLQIAQKIGHMDNIATTSFNMAVLYSRQGDSTLALPLAQEAMKIWSKMGNLNAQRAQTLVAQLQGGNKTKVEDTTAIPAQAAFEAFQLAASLQDMQTAVKRYPFMVDKGFIQTLEEIIKLQVPPDIKPEYEQRLAALRQIAAQK